MKVSLFVSVLLAAGLLSAVAQSPKPAADPAEQSRIKAENAKLAAVCQSALQGNVAAANELLQLTAGRKDGPAVMMRIQVYATFGNKLEALQEAFNARAVIQVWTEGHIAAILKQAPAGSPLAALREAVNAGRLDAGVLTAAGLSVPADYAQQRAAALAAADKRLAGIKLAKDLPGANDLLNLCGIATYNEYCKKYAALPTTAKLVPPVK